MKLMLREKQLFQGDMESPDLSSGPIKLRLFVLIITYARKKELRVRLRVNGHGGRLTHSFIRSFIHLGLFIEINYLSSFELGTGRTLFKCTGSGILGASAQIQALTMYQLCHG